MEKGLGLLHRTLNPLLVWCDRNAHFLKQTWIYSIFTIATVFAVGSISLGFLEIIVQTH